MFLPRYLNFLLNNRIISFGFIPFYIVVLSINFVLPAWFFISFDVGSYIVKLGISLFFSAVEHIECEYRCTGR